MWQSYPGLEKRLKHQGWGLGSNPASFFHYRDLKSINDSNVQTQHFPATTCNEQISNGAINSNPPSIRSQLLLLFVKLSHLKNVNLLGKFEGSSKHFEGQKLEARRRFIILRWNLGVVSGRRKKRQPMKFTFCFLASNFERCGFPELGFLWIFLKFIEEIFFGAAEKNAESCLMKK